MNNADKKDLTVTISSLVYEFAFISTAEIPFRQYVVNACAMNHCGMYGKTWQCPPGVGAFEELQKECLSYQKALVFTTCHKLEDSFDIDGMRTGRKIHEAITDRVAELFFGDRIKVLSAEGCGLCKMCTYPVSPCRFPDKARSSVEANGISVVELTDKCGIHYKNEQNTVTYFSLILYD